MGELTTQLPATELVDGKKCYPSEITLTGTASSAGVVVTGTGTLFQTELFMNDQATAAFPFATTDQGNWNANANSPALIGSVGTESYSYTVNVAGTTNLDGNNSFSVGDKIAFYEGRWIKATRQNRYSPLRYKYLYSAVNNELREIIAVNGETGLILKTAFTVDLSAEDVMVPDIATVYKSISINPTGAGGIIGTVDKAAVIIDANSVINFDNDGGLYPICVDGSASDLQITTQI